MFITNPTAYLPVVPLMILRLYRALRYWLTVPKRRIGQRCMFVRTSPVWHQLMRCASWNSYCKWLIGGGPGLFPQTFIQCEGVGVGAGGRIDPGVGVGYGIGVGVGYGISVGVGYGIGVGVGYGIGVG